MRVPRGLIVAAGLTPIIALFALLIFALTRPEQNPGSLAVFDSTGEVRIRERPAADFTLELFDGSEFDSKSLRGQWVMVDFWASWCPPCRAEAGALENVWQQYRTRGFAFVGIDIWDRDEERVAEFLRKTGASYIIGLDPRGELAVEFGVTGIPEKYFIDPSGVIVRKFVGPMNEARLSAILDELLARQTSLGERAFRMMAEQYDVRQPGRYAYSSPNLAHGL